MNLSDKLGAVEIKYDNRISESDRNYCEAHQKAYDDARNSLSEFKMIFEDMIDRQKELLEGYEYSDYSYNSYLYFDNFDIDTIVTRLDEIHKLFISRIVQYFNRTYKVTVNLSVLTKELLPQLPKDKYGDDITKGDAVTEHHNKLQSLRVDYKDIIDKIFIQIGERTFSEQAIKEIKDKCHNAVWKFGDGSCYYELKKDIIHLNEYYCSFHSYYRHPYWNLTGDMVSVISALAHYETKSTDFVPTELNRFDTYHEIMSSEIEFDNLQYVKLIRLYKNGRVDIKFKKAEYASEFVREYLGTQF